MTGQVFGWYQIAASKATCDPFTWATQARAAATAAGVDLSAFTNFVYAFPKANSCGWSGPRRDARVRTAGTTARSSCGSSPTSSGHNFGVHHASSLSCTSGARPGCRSRRPARSSEYGDPFTVMGSGSSAHDHATHLGQFGWLPGERDPDGRPGRPVRSSGPSSTARPAATGCSGSTATTGPRSTSTSARSTDRTSTTSARPTPAVNGVTIRISPDAPSPGYGLSQTQLVDTTPNTTTYARLAAGRRRDPRPTRSPASRITTAVGRLRASRPSASSTRSRRAPRAARGDPDECDDRRRDLDDGARQLRRRPLPGAPRRGRGRRRRPALSFSDTGPDARDDLRLPGRSPSTARATRARPRRPARRRPPSGTDVTPPSRVEVAQGEARRRRRRSCTGRRRPTTSGWPATRSTGSA